MRLRTPLWNSPMCFSDLGATETVSGGIGATDHLAFTALKLPGVQTVQSHAGYDVRTHHTNADFVERIEPDALKQAAVVTAMVLCHAAMRDQRMPR